MTKQTATQRLESQLAQAQEALEQAQERAQAARDAYRGALAQGDDAKAHAAAQQAQEADQQAQREADRIEVLREQVEDAEHADHLPAFEQADAAVHAAMDAENRIHSRLAKSLEQLAKLRADVAAAHLTTHHKIRAAKQLADKAHVERPRYQRQRLSQAPEMKHAAKVRELLHVGAYQDQLIHNEVHG